MKQLAYISNHARIENNQLYRNGELVLQSDAGNFADFAKQAYKALSIQYPKFYKMDHLSKLAILATELVLGSDYDHQNVALLFCNHAGSLDTDIRHQETIQEKANYYPSPAIFVYTLANICLGEVSIRHDLKSENIFLIGEEYDAETICTYASYLLQSKRADAVLCGWIDLMQENYKAVLYLVGSNGNLQHTMNQVNDLIK